MLDTDGNLAMEQRDESGIAQLADTAVDRLDARADIVCNLLAARVQDELVRWRKVEPFDEILL